MAAVGTTKESVSVMGDRFALSVLLGSGTSARVFLATDLRLQCPVAVKVLHESLASDARFVAQLRREARLASTLSHDHIVTILDSGATAVDGMEIPFIATEYMAGGSLAAMLDGGVILDPAQTAMLGRQAADALKYAHKEGLVHRDVKPSNLLFDFDGRLALADFGIARAVAEASVTEPTDSGAWCHPVRIPEAVMGRRAEPRSDVYSLALVLLECITGEVPLLGDSPVATMGRRIAESVEVPSGLGALGDALEVATRRDPDDRCTAAELTAMLESACAELGQPSPLPLRPVVVGGDETAELTIDRTGGSVRILGVAPLGTPSAAAVGSPPMVNRVCFRPLKWTPMRQS
ncbi:MAG: serine/threonine protein kinase [Microthrixaceae bacterium]|nr:serine/threonine protein kinase [Microthrixaceae bacterium]